MTKCSKDIYSLKDKCEILIGIFCLKIEKIDIGNGFTITWSPISPHISTSNASVMWKNSIQTDSKPLLSEYIQFWSLLTRNSDFWLVCHPRMALSADATTVEPLYRGHALSVNLSIEHFE